MIKKKKIVSAILGMLLAFNSMYIGQAAYAVDNTEAISTEVEAVTEGTTEAISTEAEAVTEGTTEAISTEAEAVTEGTTEADATEATEEPAVTTVTGEIEDGKHAAIIELELVGGSLEAGNQVTYHITLENIYSEDITIVEEIDGVTFSPVTQMQLWSSLGGGTYKFLDRIEATYVTADGSPCDFTQVTYNSSEFYGNYYSVVEKGASIHPSETFEFNVSFVVPEDISDTDAFWIDIYTLPVSVLDNEKIDVSEASYASAPWNYIEPQFDVQATPVTDIVAGEDALVKIQITYTGADEAVLDEYWCFYYTDYVDVDASLHIMDEDGNVLPNTGNTISFASGETKTYYLSFTIPETNYTGLTLLFECNGDADYAVRPWLSTDISLELISSFLLYDVDEEMPSVHLAANEISALKNSIFTAEELASDASLQVKLIANQMDASDISESDMSLIQSAAGGKNIGLFMDLTIEKIVNGQSTLLTQLNAPISVTVTIPEELRADNRNFTVIRLHDGVAEELADFDDDANTVTFATDKFSTYVLVYEDVATTTPVETSTVGSPKTGDQTLMLPVIVLLLLSAGAFAGMLYMKKRKIY